MKWHTGVDLGASPFKLSYRDKFLFLGSCFSEEIGSRVGEHGFETLCNPFGVLYNPFSIASSLERLISKSEFTAEDIVKEGSLYKSIYHSSEYWSEDGRQLIDNINQNLREASDFLERASTINLTFGTIWAYSRKSDNRIVSNCHRQPAGSFNRVAISLDESYDLISSCIRALPDKRWVISISPVRHLKDGAVSNMVSKATLVLLTNRLVSEYENVVYFPSYEIVMDELRDYRFYAPDLIHLSQQATQYLWERFLNFIFDKPSLDLIEDYSRLINMKSHRPLFPNSMDYKKFKKGIEQLETHIAMKKQSLFPL